MTARRSRGRPSEPRPKGPPRIVKGLFRRLSPVKLFFPMRILAVDFGEKRIGLATSDASGTLATPRRTLSRREDEAAVDEILAFCREEEIGTILRSTGTWAVPGPSRI